MKKNIKKVHSRENTTHPNTLDQTFIFFIVLCNQINSIVGLARPSIHRSVL